MANDKDEILAARERLVEAQTTLLQAYLSRIGQRYTLNPQHREHILQGLENLLESMDSSDTTPTPPTTKKNTVFDKNRAAEIRDSLGLTQTELGKKIGIYPSNICKYGTGQIRLKRPPRGRTGKVYVQWLAQNGYNPFNV